MDFLERRRQIKNASKNKLEQKKRMFKELSGEQVEDETNGTPPNNEPVTEDSTDSKSTLTDLMGGGDSGK